MDNPRGEVQVQIGVVKQFTAETFPLRWQADVCGYEKVLGRINLASISPKGWAEEDPSIIELCVWDQSDKGIRQHVIKVNGNRPYDQRCLRVETPKMIAVVILKIWWEKRYHQTLPDPCHVATKIEVSIEVSRRW